MTYLDSPQHIVDWWWKVIIRYDYIPYLSLKRRFAASLVTPNYQGIGD